MPTPKDHRDITIVVQPPTASRQVLYELSYIGDPASTVLEDGQADTVVNDATYPELKVFENGNLVLDVRACLSVKVDPQPGQTVHKTP